MATPQAMSGDCSLSSAGAITCTKTNGTSFGSLATPASIDLPSQVSGKLPIANGGTNASFIRFFDLEVEFPS